MRLPKGKGKYDELLGAVEQKDSSTQVQDAVNTQTPDNSDTQVPKKTSRNQLLKQGKMKQAKMILETETYKQFRMACIDLDVDMSEVTEDLIRDWLVEYKSKL